MNQVIACKQLGIQCLEAAADVAEHGHAGHALHASADDKLHITCGDRLGGKMDRLLAGAAHAVEADTGYLDGKPGEQQ